MWKHGRSAYIHHKCRCEICRNDNAAYMREYKRAYRQTPQHRAHHEPYIAAYRERHREALLTYAVEYRRKHRDEYLARERSPRGKALNREREQRRRALKRNQFIEEIDRSIVYQAWGGMCGICKQYVAEDEFQIDHRIPISRGGLHGYINVQPAHAACNASKAAKLPVA